MGLDILEHGAPGYGEGFGSFTRRCADSPANGETTTEERAGHGRSIPA